jgi:23S rRNA pseudouridine2605 synthase
MSGNGDKNLNGKSSPSSGDGENRERIAKVIARAGLCSRREAETWIAAGRVAVNGKVLEAPGVVVGPGDTVLVDGRPLPMREPPRVWRFNKPAGLVTTRKDEAGRTTVFDRLPSSLPRVLSVGRLDLSSEGLLLLTNDGELSRYLEMPSTGWVRRYRVRVHGRVDERQLQDLARGITVDGVRYQGIEAALDRQQGANAWLTIGLTEGKNREIRKVMEALGYTVSRLIRVSYGPFHLGNLPEGEVEEIKASVLRDQLGAVLAKLTKRTGDWTGETDSDRKAASRGARKDAVPNQRPPRSVNSRAAGYDEVAGSRAAPKPTGVMERHAGEPSVKHKRRIKPQPPGGHPEYQNAQDRPRSSQPNRPTRSGGRPARPGHPRRS